MSKPLERLLDWERGLLRSETLDQWLECAAQTPDGAPAGLLLADPTHEARPLLLGSREASGAMPLSRYLSKPQPTSPSHP